jgi:hypothetical protein
VTTRDALERVRKLEEKRKEQAAVKDAKAAVVATARRSSAALSKVASTPFCRRISFDLSRFYTLRMIMFLFVDVRLLVYQSILSSGEGAQDLSSTQNAPSTAAEGKDEGGTSQAAQSPQPGKPRRRASVI